MDVQEIDLLTEHVYIGVTYTDISSDDIYYGVVTQADHILTDKHTKPEPHDGCDIVLWDIITDGWLQLNYNDIKQIYITNLDVLNHLNPEDDDPPTPNILLTLGDEDSALYNNTIYTAAITIVNSVDNILASDQINLNEKERAKAICCCFKQQQNRGQDLPVAELPRIIKSPRGDKTLLDVFNIFLEHDIRILDCILLFECRIDVSSLIDDDITETEAIICRDIWLSKINEHVDLARATLMEERTIVSNETYDQRQSQDDTVTEEIFNTEKEEEIEEIDVVLGLVNEIPTEAQQDLSKMNNLLDICNYWHPLILPAPKYVIHSREWWKPSKSTEVHYYLQIPPEEIPQEIVSMLIDKYPEGEVVQARYKKRGESCGDSEPGGDGVLFYEIEVLSKGTQYTVVLQKDNPQDMYEFDDIIQGGENSPRTVWEKNVDQNINAEKNNINNLLDILKYTQFPVNETSDLSETINFLPYEDGYLLHWGFVTYAIKYLAIEQYYGKNDYGIKYYEMLPGCKPGSFEARFKPLIESFQHEGFDPDLSNICVYKNNTIANGSHTITCCVYNNISDVTYYNINKLTKDYRKPRITELPGVPRIITEDDKTLLTGEMERIKQLFFK